MTTATTKALLPRFLVVGGFGFLLDAGLFQSLIITGLGPISARAISASASSRSSGDEGSARGRFKQRGRRLMNRAPSGG